MHNAGYETFPGLDRMTAVVPLSGTVVARPGMSVRDVRARDWDGQDAAWDAAVRIWLTSVKSGHSKAAYLRDITLWRDWCAARGTPLDDPRRNDVDDWRDHLPGAASTKARRMSAVSSFYGYWLAEDIVTRNPAANAARPTVSAAPRSINLTRVQSLTLLEYLNGISDPRPGVIFRLLAETGMRVGELTAARAEDLSETGGHNVLSIKRKGHDDGQLLPIANGTHRRVRAYLDGRREGYILHVARSERRKGDGQMDRSYVRRLLRRIAREAGLSEAVHTRMHPHVLRHSAATMLAADGVPPHEIQLLLGHADLRTTQRYIHHQRELDESPVYDLARLISTRPGA